MSALRFSVPGRPVLLTGVYVADGQPVRDAELLAVVSEVRAAQDHLAAAQTRLEDAVAALLGITSAGEPEEGRCGRWMRIAGARCARHRGHINACRTRRAMDDESRVRGMRRRAS